MKRLQILGTILVAFGVLELVLVLVLIPGTILGALDDPAFGAFVGVGAVALALAAVGHLTSGVLALRRRGRIASIVGLFGGLLTLPTCYCAGPAVGLLVAGLLVLLDDEVVRLYEIGDG